MALSAEQQKQLELALKTRYQQLISEVRQELGQDGEQHFADFAEAGGSDQGDESVADALADIAAARVDRQVNEMRAIESARKQIKMGEYGVCGDCGEAIRFERLQAYPTAVRCVNCQQQYEKTHASENTPSI
ncbi:MAG: TraR/DksA family transcriptional regulator [Sulfurimicrobium sp.]|nr:TraR/DksA family transcriptional regulator [Sulfurimicrobium sp.]MDZ7656906.1 TraR/DksA family transcriptional regulator [Sulfurimicrobium sp.]